MTKSLRHLHLQWISSTASVGFAHVFEQCALNTYNVRMDELRFEWDGRKEKANVTKHGISFEEARTIFYDENAVLFFDPDHSETEDRFILLGLSFIARILVVCHCVRESETVVRLFSARKADTDEERAYWRRRK